MRTLMSEVDESRKDFDKKWKMLLNYLIRKNDEQEATIRKLRADI